MARSHLMIKWDHSFVSVGKVWAQHIRWEAGEDERGDRGITLSQIKSQSVIFRSNCPEQLLDTAKIVSACAFILRSIDAPNSVRMNGDQTPGFANTLSSYEWGKDCSPYCRETIYHMSSQSGRYEVMVSVHLASAQWRLTLHYTKTWIIWVEQRCVVPGRKSEGREIADKFCY